MFLAQELYRRTPDGDTASLSRPVSAVDPDAVPKHKSGAIWSMRFSKDGRYLAAAGQDMIVRVWQVLSSKEDRAEHEREENDSSERGGEMYPTNRGERLQAPVFKAEPIHEYHGHTDEVLDLSWSKVNPFFQFVGLSSSLLLTCCRITSSSPRPWTRLSAYGTFPAPNASAPSNTRIL